MVSLINESLYLQGQETDSLPGLNESDLSIGRHARGEEQLLFICVLNHIHYNYKNDNVGNIKET